MMFLFDLNKQRWQYLSLGFLLTIITMLASIGLLSVGGFLICGAALAGMGSATSGFNYLLPAAMVRLFSLLRIGGRYTERVCTHDATFRILKDLRIWIYQILEPLAPAHLLKQRSGDLLNRMVSDIDVLNKFYLRLLIPLGASLLLTILTTIFFRYINAKLSETMFILLVIGIAVVPLLAYYLGRTPSTLVLEKIALLRKQLIELKSHLLDLLLYGTADLAFSQLFSDHCKLLAQQNRQAWIRGLVNALISILTSVSCVMVLIFCAPMVLDQQLAGAALGSFVLLLMGVFEVLITLPQACQYIGETKLASARIYELATLKPMVQFPSQQQDCPEQLPDLIFDQVSFCYPNRTQKIFDGFSLKVWFGAHVALVGATGIGKSTFAYLAVRCFDPQKGTIYLGRQSLKTYSEKQLYDTIFYTAQNAHISQNSIRDNLLLANIHATEAAMYEALAIVELTVEVLQLPLQLETILGEFGKQFSGGQLRRLALARAILKKAPVTILDEPLEGVDTEMAQRIFNRLQALFAGKTLIVITHQVAQLPISFQQIKI